MHTFGLSNFAAQFAVRFFFVGRTDFNDELIVFAGFKEISDFVFVALIGVRSYKSAVGLGDGHECAAVNFKRKVALPSRERDCVRHNDFFGGLAIRLQFDSQVDGFAGLDLLFVGRN